MPKFAFDNRLNIINKELERLFSDQQVPFTSLFQAARYSTLSGGKRIRPLITVEMASAYGADVKASLAPACAIECIHTYSLIHDDLPCMDDEVERRGKLPLHKVVPEGLAVLTGDYLLTFAFDLVSHAPHLDELKRLNLLQTLSKRGGASGLIGGQVCDLEISPEQIDWPLLKWIYEKKTSDLFSTCFEFAAIIAGVTCKEREHFKEFARLFGIVYQLIDDFDDEQQDKEDESHLTALNLFTREELLTKTESMLQQMHHIHQKQSIQTDIQHYLIEKLESRLYAYGR